MKTILGILELLSLIVRIILGVPATLVIFAVCIYVSLVDLIAFTIYWDVEHLRNDLYEIWR